MARLALTMILFLAGCSAQSIPGTAFNPHTGVTTHRSAVIIAARDDVSRLRIRAVALEAGGARRFALLTSVLRADRNAPKIAAAWSSGQRLGYVRGDRRWSGCQFGPPCPREEVGHVPLPEAAFRQAAKDGLSFQLIGARGAYAGHAPARLFSEVLKKID